MIIGETKSFFSVTKSWWQVDKVSPMKLVEENKSLAGFNLKKLLFKQDGGEFVRAVVNKVFDYWQKGKIHPMIDSSWALEDVQEAMQKMHIHNNVGKIVIDPCLEPKPKPPTPVKTKDKKKQTSIDEKKESVTNGADDGAAVEAQIATNGNNKAQESS